MIIIDNEELNRLQDEVGDDFHKLINAYCLETDHRLKNIEQYIVNNNHDMLELDSHTLKSLSRTFGAVSLGDSYDKLEAAAKSQDSDSYLRLLRQIKAESITTVQALKNKMA